MKKTTIAAMIAMMCASTLNMKASEMFWGNANNPLVNDSGATILATSGWLIRLYDAGVNSAFDVLTDSVLSTHNWNTSDDGDGYFFQDITPAAPVAGTKIYTVLFNAATFGSATKYAIVDSAPFTVASYGTPEVPQDYNPGDVVAGDWVAVPEPSTYAFMGIGAILLLIRRFRRS